MRYGSKCCCFPPPTPACRGKPSKLNRSNSSASPLQMFSHSLKQFHPARAVDFTVQQCCSAQFCYLRSKTPCFVLLVLFCYCSPPPTPRLVSQFRRRRLSKIQSDAAASFTNLQRCKQTSAPLRSAVTLALAAITRTRDLQTSMQICLVFFQFFCCRIEKVTHIAMICFSLPPL